MAETRSIPGKAIIIHQAGDTLRRTITIKSAGVVVNLTGATIELIISMKENSASMITLSPGSGLIASDLVNGEFKIFWQPTMLLPNKNYCYKLKVTFSDDTIKTYLEDNIITL